MLERLTPAEWLIVGLQLAILGRLEQSYWLTSFGGLVAIYAFYRVQRPATKP